MFYKHFLFHMNFQVTIEAIRGPGSYSDIAIDDVYILNGTCNPTICIPYTESSVNCTFDRTNCNYNNTVGGAQWKVNGLGYHGWDLPKDHTSGNGKWKFDSVKLN